MTRSLVIAIVPVAVVSVVMLTAIAWLRHVQEVALVEGEQARSREHAALANIGHVAALAHQDLTAERELAASEHELILKLQTVNRDLIEEHQQDLVRLAHLASQVRDLDAALAALRARVMAATATSATAAAVAPGPLAPTPAPVPH